MSLGHGYILVFGCAFIHGLINYLFIDICPDVIPYATFIFSALWFYFITEYLLF